MKILVSKTDSSSLSFTGQLPPDVTVRSSSTGPGLRKRLAENTPYFLVNPEIFEYLHGLFKNEKDNASGDSQMLCKIFSNERSRVDYATENERVISEDCCFSILGKQFFFNKKLKSFQKKHACESFH